MLNTTLERTEKQAALSVYIPAFAQAKIAGVGPIKIAHVKDVDEALEAFSDHKGQNVVLLLKYVDGSRVVTAVDCKREKFLESWIDDGNGGA